MDMVGGDPFKNKSILHVTATPWSLPSFVTDVGAALAEVIRAGAADYAESGASPEAAVVETRAGEQGTRNQFLADVTPYAAGSDHDDYDSSTIAVPSLYLRDWPDIYIHTDHDTLQQIDATKLRRVALLGAASGYVYASLDAERARSLLPFYTAQSEMRLAKTFEQGRNLVEDPKLDPGTAWYEARNLMTQALHREVATLHSLTEFGGSGAPEVAHDKILSGRFFPSRSQPSTDGSTVKLRRVERRVRSRRPLGQVRWRRERFPSGSATSGRLCTRMTTFFWHASGRSVWRK